MYMHIVEVQVVHANYEVQVGGRTRTEGQVEVWHGPRGRGGRCTAY